MCVAANASELFWMAQLANIERFYTILNFHFKYQILYACKLPDWADEIPLKCEKVRFPSEMSEINSRWVIFNL